MVTSGLEHMDIFIVPRISPICFEVVAAQVPFWIRAAVRFCKTVGCKLVEQCVHIAEDTAIVGDGCKDNRGGNGTRLQ